MCENVVDRLAKVSLVSSLTVAAAILAVVTAIGAPAGSHAVNNSTNEPQDVTFSLDRVAQNPRQYSLIVSDDEEHTISGLFSIEQLQILRAIMAEAEKFAFGGEGVGTRDPITTRFMDKNEKAFIVDVQKIDNQAKLFLTLKTEIGRMTVDAGKVIRSSRREEGFFFNLLSRLESVLPKLPAHSSK